MHDVFFVFIWLLELTEADNARQRRFSNKKHANGSCRQHRNPMCSVTVNKGTTNRAYGMACPLFGTNQQLCVAIGLQVQDVSVRELWQKRT